MGPFPMTKAPIVPFHNTPPKELVTHNQAWIPRNIKPRSYTLELRKATIIPNKMAIKVDTCEVRCCQCTFKACCANRLSCFWLSDM